MRTAPVFIFDFYGTLVEDDVAVPAMWEDLARLGYRSSPALQQMFEPDGFDGTTTPHLRSSPSHDDWIQSNWRQLVRLSGVPDDAIDATLTELLASQSRYRARPVPGAQTILDKLRRHGRRIGLCSNWETPIEPFLKQTGLCGFDAISISAEIGARKPHAAIFEDIRMKLGAEPSEIVFIGDNWSTDIVGALRAGFTPVWIRGSRESHHLEHLVPEFETLADFAHCLSDQLGPPPAA